jgi:hypothetical protein
MLEVEFADTGCVYQYFDVPKVEYEALMTPGLSGGTSI